MERVEVMMMTTPHNHGFQGDEHPDMTSGDVKFRLETRPHKVFRRSNKNLHTTMKISLAVCVRVCVHARLSFFFLSFFLCSGSLSLSLPPPPPAHTRTHKRIHARTWRHALFCL